MFVAFLKAQQECSSSGIEPQLQPDHPTKALEKRMEYSRQGGPFEAFRKGYNSYYMWALGGSIYRVDGHLGEGDLDPSFD